jgi:hypothetical protein
LALQYFVEIARHFEPTILQYCRALHTPVADRYLPERVYRSHLAALERKTSSIRDQQPFEF